MSLLFLLLDPPEPPNNPPEVLDVTKSSVNLSWSRPKDDGGSRVTGYYIERKETSTEKWVRHNKTQITTTMYTVTGLVPDAEYQFRIIAQNEIGESEASPASEPVVCKDPFGKKVFALTELWKSNLLTFREEYIFCIYFYFQINQANLEKLRSLLYLRTASH